MNAYWFAVITIVMWSSLALLTDRVSHLPPLLSVGLVLTICGLMGLVKVREWKVPLKAWLVGVGGIFGYHFLLFVAFANAPAVEANMIQYLWPLFIVLFTPLLLPGNKLTRLHIIGAFLGFSGTAFVVTGGKLGLNVESLFGYGCALASAVVWACYSLLSKRLLPSNSSSAIVGGFCLVSGILSLVVYATTEQTFPALQGAEWVSIVLLGLGPMGLAFYTWNAALRKGDSRVIGSMAYMTPLLSTLLLVVVNHSPFTRIHALSIVLVTSGAIIGSLDTILPAIKLLRDRK